MTDVAANLAPPPPPSTSRPLPAHHTLTSPVSIHAMSTRSSDALSKQQLPCHPQQPASSTSSPIDTHGFSSTPGRLTRKRARSINIEEANKPRLDEPSLKSPMPMDTPPPSATTTDLICICPSPPKVPRPRNAFILYRQHHQAGVVLKYPGLANPEISKIIGELWREEPEEVKNYWKRLAEEEKARHQRQYPQYKYQPRRGGRGGPASRPTSSSGEDPGRCAKCHGRYIATPRTPSGPFTPGGSQGQSSAMQPFLTNKSRVIEQVRHHQPSMDTGPLQQGGDGGRRSSYYPQQLEQLRTIEESYGDTKRQRFDHEHSPDHLKPLSHVSQQHPTSISSPVNYAVHHPGARRTSSVGSNPYAGNAGSSKFGPDPIAPLPRPRVPLGPSGLQHDTRMPPPPRPSRHLSGIGPSPSAGGLSSRIRPAYDESLTLAPLQIPTSPSLGSDGSGARSLLGGGSTGLAVMDQYQQVQSRDSQTRGVEAMVMSIPYMSKLDLLRKISPPLGPPLPGSPVFETRGPVIAIEGVSPALLREVRPVIERALRQSGECEVRVWSELSTAKQAAFADTDSGTGKRADGDGVEQIDFQDKRTDSSGSPSVSLSSCSGGSGTSLHAAAGAEGEDPRRPGPFKYLQTILEWHFKSIEIIKHVKNKAVLGSPTSPSTPSSPSLSTSSKPLLLPVALIPDGFSLTLSDRFASTVAITDPYSPVDHWQWMATLWRGIVGADLVVYVKGSTADDLARNGSRAVECRRPGVMVVRVDAERGTVDEKTERRLAFEVMEWVRAGSYRDGYFYAVDPLA